MNLQLRHKETNKIHSMIYSHWIFEIVNKGLANEYIVLEYPDIVQLINIDPEGKKTNVKITERKTAQNEVQKYPNTLEFIDIDVKKQINSDINQSEKIYREHKRLDKMTNRKNPLRNRIFYYLSFLLIFPLFSKNIRIKTIEIINENINVIQTITAIIMIALTIWIILLM